jgi:hypothetical protein
VINSERIGQALKLYADALRGYLIGRLQEHYGSGQEWLEAYLESFRSEARRANVVRSMQNSSSPEEAFDLTHVKDLLLGNREVFAADFGRDYNRAVTWADEISDVRHAWAHQNELDPDDVTRALDSMSRVLLKIGAKDVAKRIKNLRDDVLPQQAPAGDLPAWWQLAEPHEDIRKGNFDENTFAAKLDDVLAEKAPPEYQYAEEFFNKTYLTGELKALLKDTLKRLAGSGGEAVVQLRTPFGGGKTHALIALYHLIKKAADIEEMPDIQALLEEAGLEHIPHARTAALVGTALSAQGRQAEDGSRLYTLWGELAYQLGGAAAYEVVREADEARTSPGKEALRKLLEKAGRALILMDEVLVYQVKAAGTVVGETTLQAQTFAFLQELTEVVETAGAALITTFPESHLEYYDHEQAPEVFNRLDKIFGRVQAVRVPVQGDEIYEVVRRRLFAKISDPKRVVAAYQASYRDHRDDLPSEVRGSEYGKRMLRAYPFHPELIGVLYERWGTMQTFQKTRGVLRLLARIIEYGYLSNAARALITLGDVGLDDPDLRGTITDTLKDANWDPVITSDITPGKAAHLDRELGGEYAKQRLCQAVAGAIFMYSHSGGSGDRGASESRLRLALLQPQGITALLISDALARMKDRLYYLYSNGGWIFKAQQNLNAVLADRVGQVTPESARSRLEEAVSARVGGGLFKSIVWPRDHREVPDNNQLKMVLLGPDETSDDKDEERLRAMIQQNAAGGPRIHKNTLVYLSGEKRDFVQATDAARTLLALEEVSADKGMVLSNDQREDLAGRLRKAREQLPELAKAAYTLLYKPIDAQGAAITLLLGAIVKTQPNLHAAVIEVLRDRDYLLSALDPALLVQFEPYQLWPEEEATLDLRNLREYFERYPHLPMLESVEVLQRAVIRGVQNGLLEAAVKSDDGYGTVWRRGNPPCPEDLFFAHHYLLARVGTIPREEKTASASAAGGAAPPRPDEVSGGANLAPNPSARASANAKTTAVRLRFDALQITQIPTLIDVANALEDAKGEVSIEAVIAASNSAGLDESVLEMSVRELLSQHDLAVEWEED